MTRKKVTNTITRPFAHVHKTLTALGFSEKATLAGSVYELSFRSPTSHQSYTYLIPTYNDDRGSTCVHLHEASFKESGEIPAQAFSAARHVLSEVAQYLTSHGQKTAATGTAGAVNGHLANSPAR
ncbi:hypothetical protein [Paenibacillus xerothermodurans]|uniref:Uncharacterized protein n=1 Tax=Paenibacillus xerothermodurans TaxID=1977292 RepID=A0A2W1N8Z4_PAEXE|nr:hypothetical protein [Paenibacillus xerothermodurans]PZE20130.1 hypothetical protein CBW46_014640 [Paenibacillus xerothermodurans]